MDSLTAMSQSLRRFYLSLLLLLLGSTCAPSIAATPLWIPVGPDGGDARSFAYVGSDPKHIYLGTTNSWVYHSVDGGSSWKRLAKLARTDDLIIDNILVDSADPKTLIVGAWVVDHPDGGIYISHDGGATWTSVADMQGQSIRALSQAASNPKILIAGTLKGVYRSVDGGVQWTLISPPGSNELHQVESIAIDPKDPQVIYAGTWHLPWKTLDGGAHWHNIKQGLIDDSDVFSIIIDPVQTSTVYTSACSGIYKSDDGGELYKKVQGIPATARRTRVLAQDPVNRSVVYAGTTEGLYRTVAAGTNWMRMTGPDVIVNDVYVDPSNPQHVLLATDRSGVLESRDGTVSFRSANAGFSQRQVSTVLVDAKHPQTLYAGVVNDKVYGGVFVSQDNGATWLQRSNGLDGRDVFSLTQSADGSILAGTSHSVFRWSGSQWIEDGKVVNHRDKAAVKVVNRKRVVTTVPVALPAGRIESKVSALAATDGTWYAAASDGVYVRPTQASAWQGPMVKQQGFLAVGASGAVALAARRESLTLSADGGKTWQPVALPAKLTAVRAVAISPSGMLWVGGREGLFHSTDNGQSWQGVDNLPFRDINGLSYDAELQRVVVTSWTSTWVLAVSDTEKGWKFWDAGWRVHSVRSSRGRLVAASLYDGVVMQPQQAATQAVASTKR